MKTLSTPEEYFEKGIAEITAGRIQDGITLLERSLELRPDWTEPVGHLGWAYYNLGHYTKSLELYLRIVKSDDSCVEAWLRAGECKFELGSYEEAKKCFNKCIDLKPDFIPALLNLARMYLYEFNNQKTEGI